MFVLINICKQLQSIEPWLMQLVYDRMDLGNSLITKEQISLALFFFGHTYCNHELGNFNVFNLRMREGKS